MDSRRFSGKHVSLFESGIWLLLLIIRSFIALTACGTAHRLTATSTNYSLFPRRVQNVAIIGAGAAGLVTAKVFAQTGFNITVFERNSHIGGVWEYGIQDNPMYRTLRTNLPTEIMSVNYEDPFIIPTIEERNNDCTSYASHDEVLQYLKNFADKYSLGKYVKFDSTVIKVERSSNSWTLHHISSGSSIGGSSSAKDSVVEKTDFDAVIVCNGHFSAPFVPHAVPGLSGYAGVSMHSIRYDSLKGDPSLLAGKRVLVVGGKSSATDMAREILLSGVAEEVRISDRNLDSSFGVLYPDGTMTSVDSARTSKRDGYYVFHPSIRYINEGSRTITFVDGASADIDVILWCTGYLYDFPFLPTQSGDECLAEKNQELKGEEGAGHTGFRIRLEGGKRLRGLHLKLIHQEEPTMAFIGLPFSVVPFPLFYFQARLLAALYKGEVSLPDMDERQRLLLEEEKELRQRGLFEEKYHYLGGPAQWDYCRTLTELFAPSGRVGSCVSSTTPPTSSSSANEDESACLQAYITMLQQIYEDNSARRPAFTGAPDTYRSRRYSIDW